MTGVRIRAVEHEDGYVFSVAVSDSIAAREAKREAARKGNASRWGKRGAL